MKRIIGRIVIGLLFVALFIGSFLGSYFFFKERTTKFDASYLTVFAEQENEYYLQKADANITFYLDTNRDSSYSDQFRLVDSEEREFHPTVKKVKKGQFKILPPEGGYEAGKRYTLELRDGTSFSGTQLKNVRLLVFCIVREDIERYQFQDRVKQIGEESLNQLSEDTLRLPSGSYQVGDILFGTDANQEYVIWKITELLEDNTAKVEIPALDEAYSDLQLYHEYSWSIEDITANPDLEIEIVENVKKNAFYRNLMMTAYAAGEQEKDGDFKVKITPDKRDNSLEIEITMTLLPGENGLFGISQLKNQEVSITLKAKAGCTVRCNIAGLSDWDLSASLTTEFSWTVDIALYSGTNKKDTELGKLFEEGNAFADKIQYHNNVRRITETLDKIAADASGGELKLFDWKLPIPSIPGLYFSTEVKLFAKLEMAAELTVGQQNKTTTVVGVYFRNKEFKPYSQTYQYDNSATLVLKGKAKVKAGVKLVLKATLISDKLANVNLDPQVGLYADLYVTLPIVAPSDITEENFIYSYFEPGVYFSANVNATVNLLLKKFEFSFELVEKKFPFEALTLGNKKIARGISANLQTVRAIDNRIAVPDILFEYYDVKGGRLGSEILDSGKVKFLTSEGESLEAENGKLILPSVNASGTIYLTAVYKHTDGMSYSAVFRVLLSGSMLEGKVSAYSADTSSSSLQGAVVKIYPVTDSANPIGTVTTDAEGKFSCSVTAGNYRIVISASGYQTLTSLQTVEDGEIKYTEHILLIDDGQSGMGTASGQISNALNGNGLSGVTLRLRQNWNNTSGDYVTGFETLSQAGGTYTISGVPVGYYTVEASLDQFVTGYHNIIVLAANPKEDCDFTITPVLSDDEIRIVLTWGQTPRDLDSHLLGRSPAGDVFHIFYSDKVYSYQNMEMANLDVDDTTSYGPETITILQEIHGTYVYAVHDYTNRGSSGSTALSYSEAVVKVYKGSMQIGEYHVPTGQTGTYWTVFEISGDGRIVPINSVSNTEPAV